MEHSPANVFSLLTSILLLENRVDEQSTIDNDDFVLVFREEIFVQASTKRISGKEILADFV